MKFNFVLFFHQQFKLSWDFSTTSSKIAYAATKHNIADKQQFVQIVYEAWNLLFSSCGNHDPTSGSRESYPANGIQLHWVADSRLSSESLQLTGSVTWMKYRFIAKTEVVNGRTQTKPNGGEGCGASWSRPTRRGYEQCFSQPSRTFSFQSQVMCSCQWSLSRSRKVCIGTKL